VRLLVETSRIAHVDYYRCDGCGHVWTVSKNDPETPVLHVTPLPIRNPA